MKKCFKCEVEKPIDQFSWDKNTNRPQSYCKPCKNLRSREYYEATKDMQKERKKGYNKTPKRQEYNRRYNEMHKDRLKKYIQDNIEHVRELKRVIEQRRRSKVYAGGSYSLKDWKDLCAYYGNMCISCYSTEKLTVDHVIPVSLGGTNTLDNLQPLCKLCNSRKGTKILDYKFWFMVA